MEMGVFMMKLGIKPSLKVIGVLVLTLLFLWACGNDSSSYSTDPAQDNDSYSLETFFDQVNYANDEFDQLVDHLDELLANQPIHPFAFESDQGESQNNVTEILNNFKPGPSPQHTRVGENEEYLFYEFESSDGEAESSGNNFMGLYFVNGALVQAAIFTDQQDLEESQFMEASQVEKSIQEGASIADLGQKEPTLLAYSQMNFDGVIHHLPAVASLTETGGHMLQLPIYDQDYQLQTSDILGMQYLQAASINNTMINHMLSYYTEDILGLEPSSSDSQQAGGSLMDEEEFQSSSQAIEDQARQSDENNPLTLDQVLDEMGEPMNQGAGAINYQSQNADGAVETFTVIHNEDNEVVALSRQRQSNQLEFPFDQASIEELAYLDPSTPIETIEENYTPAHYMEYNLESGDTVYMWSKDDPEAAVNVVQVIYGPDGQISGIAFDGNQESAEEDQN